jgi:hypothetical protein
MNAAPNIFGPAGGTGSGAAAHREIGLAERASGSWEDFG